jgi:hypothetical protein
MVRFRVYKNFLDIQNRWDYVISPVPGILNNHETAFPKLGLFPLPGDGKETPILMGPLETAELSRWTKPTNAVILLQLIFKTILILIMEHFLTYIIKLHYNISRIYMCVCGPSIHRNWQ